jgi:hypothetical protein
MTQHRTSPGPPPTVDSLKAVGVKGVLVACLTCRRSGALSFERLGVAGAVSFPMIARIRLVCASCGAPDPNIMPDWSGYRPSGSGGRA